MVRAFKQIISYSCRDYSKSGPLSLLEASNNAARDYLYETADRPQFSEALYGLQNPCYYGTSNDKSVAYPDIKPSITINGGTYEGLHRESVTTHQGTTYENSSSLFSSSLSYHKAKSTSSIAQLEEKKVEVKSQKSEPQPKKEEKKTHRKSEEDQDSDKKPNMSYVALIERAIKSDPHQKMQVCIVTEKVAMDYILFPSHSRSLAVKFHLSMDFRPFFLL